nr:hypothetical protein [Pedobacter panaciterrae]
MITFVYAVLVFLVLRFSVTLFNFLSNPKLGYYGKHFTDKVSIIISLPDVNDDPSSLIASIEAQDYKNVEVLVKKYSETTKKVVAKSTGSFILFLDVNTVINKGLINNLICRVKVFDLDLLSIIPNRKFSKVFGRFVYPLSDFVMLNLLPLRLVRLSTQQIFAVANTGCMFFKASSYMKGDWYENTDGEGSESTDIARLMKQMKLKTEVLLANKFIYIDEKVRLDKVSSQLLVAFGNNLLAVLIYLLLIIAGPIVVLINFDPVLLVLPIGLIFLSRVMISFLTAQNPVINVLIHPIQMIMLFVLLLNGLWNKVLTSVKHKL